MDSGDIQKGARYGKERVPKAKTGKGALDGKLPIPSANARVIPVPKKVARTFDLRKVTHARIKNTNQGMHVHLHAGEKGRRIATLKSIHNVVHVVPVQGEKRKATQEQDAFFNRMIQEKPLFTPSPSKKSGNPPKARLTTPHRSAYLLTYSPNGSVRVEPRVYKERDSAVTLSVITLKNGSKGLRATDGTNTWFATQKEEQQFREAHKQRKVPFFAPRNRAGKPLSEKQLALRRTGNRRR
jgi:hypothetical protein